MVRVEKEVIFEDGVDIIGFMKLMGFGIEWKWWCGKLY